MKNILMIGTGGTIASEMTDDGLTPELTPEQLLRYVPAISGLCRVDCLSLFSIDSTNVTPAHWTRIAAALRENYARYDGSSATARTPWPILPRRSRIWCRARESR